MNIRVKLKTWWERNGGDRFVVRLNTVFEALVNLAIAILLISSIVAVVVSAFRGDGLNTLIYAVSSLIIAFIARLI